MHHYHHFYDTDMMTIPEFKIANKMHICKDKETKFLTDHLDEREAEEARIKAEKEAEAAAQLAANTAGSKGGKADAKKDAKGGAKGKNAAPVDDKNAPAAITVEYPEIEELPNYLIYEKKYNFKDSGSTCLLYTSPSPRDGLLSRMPSSA